MQDDPKALCDKCGFCGMAFSNSPPDWNDRYEHLVDQHNFGQCRNKRFYRADHFQQHLKHCHGIRRGEWNKSLETVCMKDGLGDQSDRSPSKTNLGES